jgi:hypothetical protein
MSETVVVSVFILFHDTVYEAYFFITKAKDTLCLYIPERIITFEVERDIVPQGKQPAVIGSGHEDGTAASGSFLQQLLQRHPTSRVGFKPSIGKALLLQYYKHF